MKLRIKETGELLEDVKFIDTTLHKITIQYLDDGVLRECSIKNLSDIEEVKDYEEPKGIQKIHKHGDDIVIRMGSEKEAKKAVERLRAWTRLKDKGFRFRWVDMQTGQIKYGFFLEKGQKFARKDEDDLLLLFGGEE